MQNFLRNISKKSKKFFNLINIFDQNKSNFDLELYLYKTLEERNIRLKISNKDSIEEVINKLATDYNQYKNKIISLKNQQTKLTANNFLLKIKIKYLREKCNSYKTQIDTLKSQGDAPNE